MYSGPARTGLMRAFAAEFSSVFFFLLFLSQHNWFAAASVASYSAAAAPAARDVRVGHWNVYWKALDDPKGQEAIKTGIDTAVHEGGDFDFFAILEATGARARFPDWVQSSTALKEGSGMQVVHGRSYYETVALFYRAEAWEPVWSEVNEFEKGRPFISGLFKFREADGGDDGSAFFSCERAVWVVAAHLPHYTKKYNGRKAGDHIRDTLIKGQAITGCDASAMATIVMGDFNEFGACTLPPAEECRVEGFRPAAQNMRPLWDYLGEGNFADAVDPTRPTCCTKFHEGTHDDWGHEYDHVYYARSFLNATRPSAFIPYKYPGYNNCQGVACTGLLDGARPWSQGSWHRGWQTTLTMLQGEGATQFV